MHDTGPFEITISIMVYKENLGLSYLELGKKREAEKKLDILILLTFGLGKDYSLQFAGYGDYVSTQKLMFNGITKLIY